MGFRGLSQREFLIDEDFDGAALYDAEQVVARHERQPERKPPETLHHLDKIQSNRSVTQLHLIRPQIAWGMVALFLID